MHATPRTSSVQRRRVMAHRGAMDTFGFFNLLTDELLLETIEELLPEHRERLFPPTETLSMFLDQVCQADGSCQNVVNRSAVMRAMHDLPRCSSHTGAYCRARQRLPLTLVSEVTRFLGRAIEDQAPDAWKWRGRRVLLIDGTSVIMPDTEANQAAFPQQGNQLPGLGFPMCRIVGIMSLAAGTLLNAAMGACKGKDTGETTLFRQLMDTLEAGDVLLGDSLYPSYFALAELRQRGVDFLMEQNGRRQRVTDFEKGTRLGSDDHVIELSRPIRPEWMSEEDYARMPESLTVREFKAGGRVMVTSLQDPPNKELKALYRCRWHVELDFLNIKQSMGMDMLSCRTPEMIKKEIWVYLLGYNLIRLLMTQSSKLVDVSPRYISYKHCLQLWLCWSSQPDHSTKDPTALFELMAQQRVGNRPNRIEPRAVKRRNKPYPLLTESRPAARQRVLDFGHPKKLK